MARQIRAGLGLSISHGKGCSADFTGSFDSLRMTKPSDHNKFSMVRLPIEWREIIELFAGADETCRNSKFILDCDYDAAFAAAVELGDDTPVSPIAL